MESQSGLGSMIQIKAQGAQNEYVNSCPSTSPFIQIYKRYFNFATYEKIERLAGLKYGKKYIFNIEPEAHGDLLGDIIFVLDIIRLGDPGDGTWFTDNYGQALFEKIELKIGELTIDTITSEWLDMYDNVFLSDSRYTAMNWLVKRGFPIDTVGVETSASPPYGTLYVPLRLFFNKKKTDMLPICALPHQAIQLIFHVRSFNQLITTDAVTGNRYDTYPTPNQDVTDYPRLLFKEYIIDDNLREYFMNNPLKYLIKTTQPGAPMTFDDSPTNFSDTTKFKYYPETNATVSLFTWALRSNVATSANTVIGTGNDYFNYSNTMIRTGIYMNDRWVDELQIGDREYWRYLQPLMYLSANPRSEIYNWSLGLKNNPTISQEWGNLDFSRIKRDQFFFEMNTSETNLELLMFMTTTNFMEIADGVIKSYFIY